MNPIDATLAEFGRSLGLADLRLRPDAGAVLAFERMGILAFDRAGPGESAVIVSLSRPLPTAALDARRLLSAAHYRGRANSLPIQAAVRHDHLVLAVVLTTEDFTLPRLHEVLRGLDRQHQSLEVCA